MVAAFNALLDQPILLLAVLAAGAGIGITVEKYVSAQNRAKWRAYYQGRKSRNKPTHRDGAAHGRKDLAADQLRIVMNAKFRPRALLNRPEAKVFQSLDRIVIARNLEWQVMAQVSVGEFLACDDPEAFGCINSKRVDFVLMDEKCQARHALEYQGNGHHQGSAAARDAVKKEALRRAGIGYHEIVAGHTTPRELKQLIEKLVPELVPF